MCCIAVATVASSLALANADFVRVLSSDLTALLRTRRFSFCRLRLIWLLMLATVSPESSCVDRWTRPGHVSGPPIRGKPRSDPLASNPAPGWPRFRYERPPLHVHAHR